MIIDSHQHFWKFDAAIDTWITDELSAIQRDFMPSDLKPILDANKVDGCVTVQSRQTIADTQYLLKLADENTFIKGVVGWVDLMSQDLDKQLAEFSPFGKLKGFRHVIQSEPAGFMLNSSFINGVNSLRKFNFTYDLLIVSKQLKEAVEFINNVDDIPIVVDHLAKPNIAGAELTNWRSSMKELAGRKNVFCKLSGMVTEARWKKWKKEDFRPYTDVILEAFGADRIMYGSDWPVCLLSASYEQQLEITMSCISELKSVDQEKIMGTNAIQFYNLK